MKSRFDPGGWADAAFADLAVPARSSRCVEKLDWAPFPG